MALKTKKSPTKSAKEDKDIWQKQAIKLREEALTLKRNTLTGDVQNVRAYKYKQRELARVLTKINQAKSQEKK